MKNAFLFCCLLALAAIVGTNFAWSTLASPGTTSLSSVTIGDQTWMAENLNVTKFRNGDAIPQAKTEEAWLKASESQQPAWCYYDNSAANAKYGILYNWYAVNDPRGLAPVGWHIPSDDEWSVLVDYLGGQIDAGIKMKSQKGWAEDGNGTNESAFSGLPGGTCSHYGSFASLGQNACWWSSTENEDDSAWGRGLDYSEDDVTNYFYNKTFGLSVRCVKD